MSKAKSKSKRIKKRHPLIRLVILGAVLVLGINAIVCLIGGMSLTDEEKLKGTTADCALVLGAAVKPDGTPSAMLKDRLDTGIELYKKGLVDKLLFSGDDGQVEYNEVEVMRKYAIKNGVRKKDIFLDHAGFSTYESIYRAKAVFNVSSAVIVTQKYHEFRALYIAKALGLNAKGIACKDIKYSGRFYREAREVLARDKDFFKAILKVKPTFLGDVIDIRGDGRRSWPD